ncbi:MAG TPA: ATP-binding protein, partial [Holophaga sp.]|nr:ATP-binding protein [Holophaga sp.]
MRSGWHFTHRLNLGISALQACGFVAFVASMMVVSQGAIRQWVVTNLAAQAGGAAIALTGPLDFQDAHEAEAALASLSVNPRILRADAFTADGQRLASWSRPGGGEALEIPPSEGAVFRPECIEASRQVRRGDRILGTVVIRSSRAELKEGFWAILAISLVAAVPAFLLTLPVARWLRRYLSAPILGLVEVAREVSRRKDYSLRVTQRYQGDLGTLGDALNLMLTEIQERDRRLMAAKDDLEAKVAERTEDLVNVNAQLMVATESAQDANRAKSAFIANMSHELRTPLNAILLYSELLRDDAREAGQDGQVRDLERIMTAGAHLLGLIDNILDISKIEAGRMTVNVEEVHLQDLLTRVASLVRPLVEKNRNRYVVEVGPAPGSFLSDAKKVEQILCNLLSNAAKFTEDGEVRLRVGVLQAPPRLVLEVRDTGIGMTRDEMDRVFQDFIQADSQTTRKYAGTGLGLAICRRFAQLLGGAVTVESEPGKGSTFTAVLPLSSPPREDGAGPAAPPPGAPVLLVTSDPALREDLGAQLERDGVAMDSASDAGQARACLDRALPGRILLDLDLQGGDPWALLARLKQDPATHAVPVVLLGMAEDRSRGLALGAADILPKPVTPARLLAVLKARAGGQGPASVLLVEDDPFAREALARLVESQGLEARHARNGLEALEAMGASLPS